MAFRFRRSVRLMPGVRLNFGKRGMSVSAGVRGASITVGQRGVYGNVGLPGTGLSYRKRLDEPQARRSISPIPQTTQSYGLILRLRSDGTVIVEDENGVEASPDIIRRMRRQKGQQIRVWLEGEVAKLNAEYDACVNLHLETPSPRSTRFAPMKPFNEAPPVAPMHKVPSWFDRLLGRKASIEAANANAVAEHNAAMQAWLSRKQEHERKASSWNGLLTGSSSGDQSAMEKLLDLALEKIVWPKETDISFDFGNDSSTLDLDVDLPGEDDMPRKIAAVASRGIKLEMKERSEIQIRRDFARLAHATLFRLAGEAFSVLPTLREVTVSGYVQRPDAATGQMIDQYVLSVAIPRIEWEQIDFLRLDAIDPVTALERFRLVRMAERNGRLRAIQPM